MIAQTILRISHLDEDDITGLAAWVRGFNEYGFCAYDCSKCPPKVQRQFGCGFIPEFKGHGEGFHEAPPAKYKGTCPGWWIRQPFVDQVVEMRAWRKNLGNPYELPNRLREAIEFLDNMEADKAAKQHMYQMEKIKRESKRNNTSWGRR